jgi:exopolyphosphatase / guanosine-5'-triphosphate,3'-diphosphate pyrophosphatase
VAETVKSAIIDIGSNSIRLVVYQGSRRAPAQIFNEKLMVGLGSSLATSGRIEKKAFQRGLKALQRFRTLTEAMALDQVRCVATAAVRDASNGAEFLAAARDIGLDIDLLSGGEEAEAAGFGVISADPAADGIAADLGGGSLELVRISNGQILRGTSFPLGVLRLPALREEHGSRFRRYIGALLAEAGWPGEDKALPLYLVGGSWRAIARYHMLRTRDPLPVMSGHRIPVSAVPTLARRLAETPIADLSVLPGLATARVASMPDAGELLLALTRALRPPTLLVSSSGLREGLLYQALPKDVRAQDPLIVAALAEGRRFARFTPNGDVIDSWIAPLFTRDDAAAARLRRAACLLVDVAATANPDFRSDRAVEVALHGQWMGVGPEDRQVLAQTLYTAAGGSGRLFKAITARGLGPRLKRAIWWGQALRLAQRLAGGAREPLLVTTLRDAGDTIQLGVRAGHEALIGEQVEKRLRQLAATVGRDYRITAA